MYMYTIYHMYAFPVCVVLFCVCASRIKGAEGLGISIVGMSLV